ncbi:MAG: class I SAM-dependent methyltransferase [Planctomycetes bacterium]|nr:class I SAM-dependent methyltransferase [Planctomycetota bacterium]
MTKIDNGYELIDCGEERRLERFGVFIFDRPMPHARWRKSREPEIWRSANAYYHRSDKGGGEWEFRTKVQDSFEIALDELKLILKPTDFGHVGYFPEHLRHWKLCAESIRHRPRILNLFAYTGGSSVLLAKAGAQVTHVDSSRGIIDWTKENAALNEVPADGIRYICEDAAKFVKREVKRGNAYDGVILDPPSFGRGPKGEVFKIEDEILSMLCGVCSLLSKEAAFVLLSAHSPGFTPLVLEKLLADALADRIPGSRIVSAEMTIESPDGKVVLPTGCCASAQLSIE